MDREVLLRFLDTLDPDAPITMNVRYLKHFIRSQPGDEVPWFPVPEWYSSAVTRHKKAPDSEMAKTVRGNPQPMEETYDIAGKTNQDS